MDVQSTIAQIRTRDASRTDASQPAEMPMPIKQFITDGKAAALRNIIRELYTVEVRSQLHNEDFTVFGDQATEIKRLFEATQKSQKTSISSRNATACLVTINPPPELDIHLFRDYVESLIQKLQCSGMTGSYYYEARQPITPFGAHVHIALNFTEVEVPSEFRKALVQKCTAKKLPIFLKRPTHHQLNVKFSSHITGYQNFLSYANNPKKSHGGIDKSKLLREELGVEPIIEF